MSTTTSSLSFNDMTTGPLSFTSVSVSETDISATGNDYISFTGNAGLEPVGTTFGTAPAYQGIAWQGFNAGVVGNTAGTPVSQLLTLNYNISAGSGGTIFGLDQLVVSDYYTPGAGVTLDAVETVSNGLGQVVATLDWNAATGSQGQWLSAGYSNLHVSIVITAAIAATGTDTSNDGALFSIMQQGYVAGSVSIDKQISVDGTHWMDVGNGVLNDPSATTGTTIYERVIVVNNSTDSLALDNAQVGDTNGPGPFTFGGQGSFNLAAGTTLTSDIVTTTAVAGHQIDTATLTGVFTDGTHSVAASASDTADYTGVNVITSGGVPGAVAIDKQVSVDGTNWFDVGSGVLNDPTAIVGGNVYYRVVVTNGNTTGPALTGAAVSDNGGPAFTFGGSASTTVAAGATITSDVSTTTAIAGHQFDTATLTGSFVSGSVTQGITASDTADYTGATGAAAIDKQVSVDGSTWYDVGSGVLNDPTALVGGQVYYRVVVTDTSSGNLTLNGANVSDNGGPAFTFGGSATTTIADGQSITSDVNTVTAIAGHQLDTATVTGTVSDGGVTQTINAADTADYTGGTGAVAIDKQVSVNGSTWVDVGSGTQNDPTAVVGSKVYFRVVVSDTSSGGLAVNGATVTDVNGPAFTFGGNTTVSIATGQTITSDVSTATAVAGHQVDTATVTGTVSAGGLTQTISASDTADYTGTTPVTGAVTIDKQVSVNGSTWVDAGSGILNDPSVLAGCKIYFRAIVVNGTNGVLSGAKITDVNGPGFTFSGAATTSIAARGTVTTDISTATAVAGHQIDTATLTGAESVAGVTTTLSASDTADYTGLAPSISVTKLPGAVVINNGAAETYTFDVTNTGTAALTNVTIKDNIGTAANPNDVTPTAVLSAGYNVGDANHTGVLGAGQTWVYTLTVTESVASAANDSGYGGAGAQNCGSGGESSGWGYSGSGGSCSTGLGSAGDHAGRFGCGGSNYGYGGSGWGNSGGDNSGGNSYCGVSYGSSGSGWGGSGWGNSGGDNSGGNSYCGVSYGSSGSGWGGSGSDGGSGWGGNSYCGVSHGSGGSGWGYDGGGSCVSVPGSVSQTDTVTVSAAAVNPAAPVSTICQTLNNCGARSGTTLWLNTSFTPTSTANGSTYTFKNISLALCSGGKTVNLDAPDSQVTFSSACTQATTVFDSQTHCWVTTLPANQACGKVFLSGLPAQVPAGDSLNNGTATWSIGSSSNNCGNGKLSWQSSATTYNSFSQGGQNCNTDYNSIGVQSCDNEGLCGASRGGNWWQAPSSGAGCATTQNSYGNCWSQQSQSCGSQTIASVCTTTVTATDSKEIQVLPGGSNISVDGTAPAGNLVSQYGTADKLEFTYNPGDTVSLAPGSGTVAAVVGGNSAPSAFLVMENTNGSQIYFEGSVVAGEKIFADATANPLTGAVITGSLAAFSTASGSVLSGLIYTSQQAFEAHTAPVQSMSYCTAGQMHLNDTVGSLKLVGYVGANGGHLMS